MISVALIFERMLILEVVRGAPTYGCSWDIFYGSMELHGFSNFGCYACDPVNLSIHHLVVERGALD